MFTCITVGHHVALGNSGVISTISATCSYITFCNNRGSILPSPVMRQAVDPDGLEIMLPAKVEGCVGVLAAGEKVPLNPASPSPQDPG